MTKREGLARRTQRSFAALRMTARTPLTSAHGKPSLQMSGYNHALGGAGASPQGRGKPCPYYIRASQADSSYSRGDPCGQYHSNTKNVSKGAVLEMEALISRALVTEMGGMLEHAWIEPQ